VVIGSINTQGLSGSWWFDYGTTTALGTQTPNEPLTNVPVPQTVTADLTSLTTGTTYYFAVVGQTLGGTVVSAPISFIPEAPPIVSNASNPTVPSATAAVSIPHFGYPFIIQGNAAVVVEQGSFGEVISCVQTVLASQPNEIPELPDFGIPDPTFQQVTPSGIDASGIVAAINFWEPRAVVTVQQQGLLTPDIQAGLDLGSQTFLLPTTLLADPEYINVGAAGLTLSIATAGSTT
jgi:hypothetical protein